MSSQKRPSEESTGSGTKKVKLEETKTPSLKSEASNLALPKMNDSSNNINAVPLALPKGGDKKKKANSKTAQSGKNGGKEDGTGQKQKATDPNKMQDVLISAGVDLKEEEALLSSTVNVSKTQQNAVVIPPHPPFLHPDQVSNFMKKVAKTQNFNLSFTKNTEILDMMSSACESYLRDIITNTIVVSRHRRKGVKVNYGRRSQVAAALRSIAINQKKEEERRMKKRIALGLEKEDYENKRSLITMPGSSRASLNFNPDSPLAAISVATLPADLTPIEAGLFIDDVNQPYCFLLPALKVAVTLDALCKVSSESILFS